MTATASASTIIAILPNGETRLSSSHPWYRYLSALVALYLGGYLSEDALQDDASRSTQAVLDSGDVAAQHLLSHIFLPADEGADDYRARLVQILYGVTP